MADTVHPSIMFPQDDWKPVVDTVTVKISAFVYDKTSSPVSVVINRNGSSVGAVSVDENGYFSHEVSLIVGVNTFEIIATDGAGLSTEDELVVVRVVTNRKQSDVDRMKALHASGNFDTWSDADKSWYLATVTRASYGSNDLNRVTNAVDLLDMIFQEMGNATGVSTLEIEDERTTWRMRDVPDLLSTGEWVNHTQQYLQNIAKIRAVFPIDAPNVPADMDNFLWNEANDIEAILVAAGAIVPLIKASQWVSGEIFCGEA